LPAAPRIDFAVPVSGTPGSAGASRRTPPVRAIQTDRDLQEHPEPERGAWLKLATIEDRLVLKSVGLLSSADAAELQNRLRAWLGL